MKKILFLLPLFTAPLSALPVGNPAETRLLCEGLLWNRTCFRPTLRIWDDFNFRAGYYGDWVFNRHLRVHDKNNSHLRSQLDHSTISTNAAYLVLNLWNCFDIFGTLGASQLYLEGNNTIFPPSTPANVGQRITIETRSDFSWSVGLRGVLWRCGKTTLGMEGQYFSTAPNVKRITEAKIRSIYLSELPPRLFAEYNDWQVGIGVAHRIWNFAPYIAYKWSASELIWRDNPTQLFINPDSFITLRDFRSKKHSGYAVGVSLIGIEEAMVTAEGRFGDEKAFYLNFQCRF